MTATATLTVDSAAGPRTITLAYERSGEGEPIVLLHGLGHRRQAWDPVSPALRSQYELIAVDLPGFGESDPMPADFPSDLTGYSTVMGEFCREMGIERPHMVGNSLGGLIALDMARVGLARSVTAFSPAGFWGPLSGRRALVMAKYLRLISRKLPIPVISALAQSTVGRFFLTFIVYARPDRLTAEYAISDALGFRNCTGFETLMESCDSLLLAGDITDARVTVAWGAKDRMLLPRQAAAVARLVPEAKLIELPGCGHTPMIDDPELVAQVILEATAGSVNA